MGAGNNFGSLLGLLPSDTKGQSATNGTQTNTNQFDAGYKANLDKVMGDTTYSKDNAITDARGAMDSAVKSALQMGAPAISSNAKAAGGYNNTTADMMGNDLTARAAAAGENAVLANIKSYSELQNNSVGVATGVLNATKGTTSVTSGVTQQEAGSKGGIGSILNPTKNSGTVICTQLHKDGHLTKDVFYADNKYVAKHFSATVRTGYIFWAMPFVRLMRRNKIAYAIGKFFGVRWSMHCASHYLPYIRPNITGRIMVIVGVAICYCIGTCISKAKAKAMWKVAI